MTDSPENEIEKSGRDSDMAVAIGEDAFRAGWIAGQASVSGQGSGVTLEQAWSDYTTPDHLCGEPL